MLNTWIFFGLVVGLTVGFRMLALKPFIKKLIGFSILGHMVNLMLLLAGTTPPHEENLGTAAFVNEVSRFDSIVDPLPQALVLTSIVISFAIMAFLVIFYLLAERDKAR